MKRILLCIFIVLLLVCLVSASRKKPGKHPRHGKGRNKQKDSEVQVSNPAEVPDTEVQPAGNTETSPDAQSGPDTQPETDEPVERPSRKGKGKNKPGKPVKNKGKPGRPEKTGGRPGKQGKNMDRPTKEERRENRKDNRKKGRPMKNQTVEDCTYSEPDISDCDPETNHFTKTRRLIAGDPQSCQPVLVTEKPCEKGSRKNKTDCKYGEPEVSECNTETNRFTKTRRLIEGDTQTCQPAIVHEKPCERGARRNRTGCKYTQGDFGECDMSIKKRMRTDTLIDPTQESERCPLERTVYEKCSRKECVHNWVLGECDSETNMALITGTLVNADGAPSHCQLLVTRHAKCKGDHARCEYGEWGEYTECADGFKSRSREMLKGKRPCSLMTEEHVEC